MAEIDPLVAEILLKGDDEFLSSMKKIGEQTAENFEKLSAAAEGGASAIALAARSIGLIEAALAGATAATIVFVEQQTELSQKTILLAQAFGTTAGQLQELEAIFASSGVKVEQFERFANRLTITIAREWPQIAESIKTYANENDAATLRVSNAILHVQEAQNKLGDNSAERSSQMQKDTSAVAEAYLKLQFAASHAASEQLGALQAVRGAQLGVTAAEEHLAELEGRPPSEAEKQNLAIAQARQAVDTARRAAADALVAQQEKAAEASLKQAQLEQSYDDLRRKAAQNSRDDLAQRQKDENAVREAIIARGEAEEKAAKFALTNVASIRDALDGIVKGNKSAATAIDLTQVSVLNLTKSIIAQAAETSKAQTPTGYELLAQLSKTLAADTDHLIDRQQRLAVVNRLAQTSMQALGASGAEILNVLEHDSDALQKFTDRASALDLKEAQHNIEAFRGSLASLNLSVSILSQQFAAAIAPAFTAFLRAIEDSLDKNNGLLHNFIDGIKSIGSAIAVIATAVDGAVDTFARLFSFDLINRAALFKAALIGIGVAITVATGPIGVMIVAIGLIITAIGSLRDNWDLVTAAVGRVWDKVKDSAVVKFLEGVLYVVLQIVKGLALIDKATASSAPKAAPATGSEVQGHAEGGMIRGPGSGTSDSILSRLSNGEFVVKAQAVQAYGAGLFHSLNNMMVPGFASGGLVPSPVRMQGGGAIPATSTLNLSIDGRTFGGLRGPKSTVDDLSSFAISRQTSSAGKAPSWQG